MDLNCDLGEGFGVYRLGCDEEAISHVTSVNVACGFHASDPLNMVRTVRLAKKHGVAVGAHPAYPDLVGFGRRPLAATPQQVQADVLYQIGALAAICRAEGVALQHVKPHGALYNAAAKDKELAVAIAGAVQAVDPQLYLVCLAQSCLSEAAKELGQPYAEEAFADRGYLADGKLVPRSQPGAVYADPQAVADRAVRMVAEGCVEAHDGQRLSLRADTICVHGDSPGAVAMIAAIRRAFAAAGIVCRPFGPQRR